MNVSLGARWEQFIEKKLESGDYQSASEVVRDGLRLIEQRDLLVQRGAIASFEDLQDALLAGVRSGPATPMVESDWAELRAELQSVRKPKRA
jgi:antitoxin ParD1/3/4